MPLPTRKPTEDKQDFILRCMRDKVMIKEYPNEQQRLAVCYQQTKK